MADLYGMFSALNTTDAHVLEEVVYNIQKYFSTRPTDIYLPEVLPYIPLGLQHPNSGVRLLVLQLINNSLTSADIVARFVSIPTILSILCLLTSVRPFST
jgi:hypothetical protein